MRAEVLRVAGVASDEPSFRALDLNLEISPTREMVCTPGDLEACFVDVAEYRGPCYVGSTSGRHRPARRRSRTGRRLARCARGSRLGTCPDLTTRATRDGADYSAMERRGELRTYPGRTVPVDVFVLQVEADLTVPKSAARLRMATAAANSGRMPLAA